MGRGGCGGAACGARVREAGEWGSCREGGEVVFGWGSGERWDLQELEGLGDGRGEVG